LVVVSNIRAIFYYIQQQYHFAKYINSGDKSDLIFNSTAIYFTLRLINETSLLLMNYKQFDRSAWFPAEAELQGDLLP